jgi:hypothetical protein
MQIIYPIVNRMAPQCVKPYVKSNKKEQNDAAGINEVVTILLVLRYHFFRPGTKLTLTGEEKL